MRNLALHWKIIIALVVGIIWSMVAGGFFGGMQTGIIDGPFETIETFHEESGDSQSHFIVTIGYSEENLSKVKFFDSNKQVIGVLQSAWDGNNSLSKKAHFKLTQRTDKHTQVMYAYKGSFLNGLTSFTSDWVNPFGTIFIRLLKFIAIPLVLFSIISGVSSLSDISKLGRMGGKTLGIYLITTVFAVTIGLVLVNLIKPGELMGEREREKNRIRYELWASDNGKEIVGSQNFLSDPVKKELLIEVKSEFSSNKKDISKYEARKESSKSGGPLQPLVDVIPENLIKSLLEGKMLQVIFFAIFFGVTMAILPKERMKGIQSFVDGAGDIFVKMVDIIMKAAPFFVFCLMAGLMTQMAGSPQELIGMFTSLGWYSMTVLIGLFFMIFIFYPSIMLILTKKELTYGGFFKRISPAQFLAFSTSSSAATLPVTIECVEERIGVDKKIASFVLPIGATVNMDGTSLYQAVAVVFLAQIHMIDLSFSTQLTIVGMATLASIGSAAVPSAGLVMLMIVLEAIGLNPAWIAIIMPVDRILDMCRTVVNVTGDATVATVIASTEGELHVVTDKQLEELDIEDLEAIN
jgi:Na+/H+-dicarboxylate symporter